MVPELEIICLDSCECFDGNKHNIQHILDTEQNENVRRVLSADLEFLDNIQVEMSTARQFMFCIRAKNLKDEQLFQLINRVEKAINEHRITSYNVCYTKLLRHKDISVIKSLIPFFTDLKDTFTQISRKG